MRQTGAGKHRRFEDIAPSPGAPSSATVQFLPFDEDEDRPATRTPVPVSPVPRRTADTLRSLPLLGHLAPTERACDKCWETFADESPYRIRCRLCRSTDSRYPDRSFAILWFGTWSICFGLLYLSGILQWAQNVRPLMKPERSGTMLLGVVGASILVFYELARRMFRARVSRASRTSAETRASSSRDRPS